MTAEITLEGVAKAFGGLAALGPVDLEIGAGEFVALLGPSGCGKSTLLRLAAGLIAPSAGRIAFPRGRPAMGFVFQEPTLMPWATALGNARLAPALKGDAEADAAARAALARMGLAEFAHAHPRALSGGMRMRVSIARALAARPKLLLMDEPFAALDEMTREELNDDLLRLAREDGLTVLFVTHSVYESVYLADRVMVMTPRPGRIAAEIRPERPAVRDAAWRLGPQFAQAARAASAALRRAVREAA